jgi:hypothetical protein
MRRRALLSDGGTTKLFTGLLKYGCKVTIREYVDSGGGQRSYPHVSHCLDNVGC